MKKQIQFLAVVFFISIANLVSAQSSIADLNIDHYPQYLVITTQVSGIFFGADIVIYSRNSPYQDQFIALEEVLQSKKKMKIRNQTDLLNALYEFGYDYVNAFNANQSSIDGSTDVGDDLSVGGSEAKFRINMVFKKR